MNHDRYREILALRQYGEASPQELFDLHRHLPGCAECQTLGVELRTLQAELPAAGLTGEVPARPGHRQPLLLPAAAAILGFLLGAFLPGSEPGNGPMDSSRLPPNELSKAQPDQGPPPVASSGGLSRLGRYWPQ